LINRVTFYSFVLFDTVLICFISYFNFYSIILFIYVTHFIAWKRKPAAKFNCILHLAYLLVFNNYLLPYYWLSYGELTCGIKNTDASVRDPMCSATAAPVERMFSQVDRCAHIVHVWEVCLFLH